MKQLSEWGSFYWVTPIVVFCIVAVFYVERKPWKKRALLAMLCMWFVALIYLLFLYRLPGGWSNLIIKPLHMYRDAISYSGSIAKNQALRQIVFNILLYVPFGTIVYVLSKKALLTVALGIGLSIITEGLQYWMGLGWLDVDDMISNVIGLIIGCIYCRLHKQTIGN